MRNEYQAKKENADKMVLTPLLLVGNELKEDQGQKGAVENNVCGVHLLLCQAGD